MGRKKREIRSDWARWRLDGVGRIEEGGWLMWQIYSAIEEVHTARATSPSHHRLPVSLFNVFDLTTTKNRGRLKRFETDPNKSWRWIVAFLDWFRVFLFNSSSELNIRHCSKAVFRDCKDTFYPRYEQCDQRLPGRGCQGESARTFILLCKILVAADESSKMKQICTARKTKSFE